MNLSNALNSHTTYTLNGMSAYQSSLHSGVDLFFKAGAARNLNILPFFSKALADNPELIDLLDQYVIGKN